MKQIVIIGGGVAGLTAGIFAKKQGFSCTLLERHSAVGGNLTGWQRQGYTVDNCIHWLTGTKPQTAYRKIWEEVGALPPAAVGEKEDGLVRTEALYTSSGKGRQLPFFRDLSRTRAAMWEISPADGREIEHFIHAVAALQGKGTFAALEKGKVLLRYGRMNLYELAARFRHPLLRAAMTDFIGGEFSAMALLCAYAVYTAGNGDIPKGGSLAMAERMGERFRELGGELRLSSPAARIRIRNGRVCGVELEDQTFLPADAVIAACDPTVTFGSLAKEVAPPPKLAKRRARPDRFPTYSSVHCAFAADAETAHHALGGTKIFGIREMTVMGRRWNRLAVREYTHDPSLAPVGKTVVQTLLFQRQGECRRWIDLHRDPHAYRQAKEALAAETACRIGEVYPELGKSLSLLDVWTPATYARWLGEKDGAYLSFAWTERVIPTAVSARVPGCRGLYLATQWQYLPGGLPNAAAAGIAAVKACLREKGVKVAHAAPVVHPPHPEGGEKGLATR